MRDDEDVAPASTRVEAATHVPEHRRRLRPAPDLQDPNRAELAIAPEPRRPPPRRRCRGAGAGPPAARRGATRGVRSRRTRRRSSTTPRRGEGRARIPERRARSRRPTTSTARRSPADPFASRRRTSAHPRRPSPWRRRGAASRAWCVTTRTTAAPASRGATPVAPTFADDACLGAALPTRKSSGRPFVGDAQPVLLATFKDGERAGLRRARGPSRRSSSARAACARQCRRRRARRRTSRSGDDAGTTSVASAGRRECAAPTPAVARDIRDEDERQCRTRGTGGSRVEDGRSRAPQDADGVVADERAAARAGHAPRPVFAPMSTMTPAERGTPPRAQPRSPRRRAGRWLRAPCRTAESGARSAARAAAHARARVPCPAES